MILSLSHSFLFIHVPKTAGTALMEALTPFSANTRRTLFRSILRRTPFVEAADKAYIRGHEPASRIRAKLSPPVFDHFFRFAVVRNPYDHAVSLYEFMKQFRIESTAARIRKMSFVEYLHYRVKRPFWNDTIFARQPAQSWFIADDSDRLLVNRVLYYESLQADFERLTADLGLPDVVLRKVNPTKTKAETRSFATYAEYYDAESMEMVQAIYARDFRNFGYALDIRQRDAVVKVAQDALPSPRTT